MTARKRRITNKELVATYEKKAANISATCAALGIDRGTFYNRRRANQELNKMLEAVEEGLIDFAESKLLQAINEENLTAIIFYLKTKGKNRGYIERQELTGSDGRDLVLPKLTESDIEEVKRLNGIK